MLFVVIRSNAMPEQYCSMGSRGLSEGYANGKVQLCEIRLEEERCSVVGAEWACDRAVNVGSETTESSMRVIRSSRERSECEARDDV